MSNEANIPDFPALEPVTTFPIAVDIHHPQEMPGLNPETRKRALEMLAGATNDAWEVERMIRKELGLPFGGTGSDKTTAAQVLHDSLFTAIYALTMLRHAVEIINTSAAADGRKVSR